MLVEVHHRLLVLFVQLSRRTLLDVFVQIETRQLLNDRVQYGFNRHFPLGSADFGKVYEPTKRLWIVPEDRILQSGLNVQLHVILDVNKIH